MATHKYRQFVIVEIDGATTPIKALPTLAFIQATVGGLIEGVEVVYNGRRRQAYVNEEGRLRDLPYNPKASRLYCAAHPFASVPGIVGPMVIDCGGRK